MDHPHEMRSLNRILANYFVLSIKMFRYECYAKGVNAYTNKQMFNDFRREINEDIEQLTAFISSSGGQPYATMIKFIKESTIEEATADDEEEEIISQMIMDFTEIHEQIEAVVQENDEAMNHFLYSIQRKLLEKRHICMQLRE